MTTPPTLETLTLDRIPTLTDEECDALYGRDIEGCALADGATWRRVCHPDCPASVLEGLPALVERWTDTRLAHLDIYHDYRDTRAMIVGAYGDAGNGDTYRVATLKECGRLRNFYYSLKARHLAHACLCAAFAACVVLGKAQTAG